MALQISTFVIRVATGVIGVVSFTDVVKDRTGANFTARALLNNGDGELNLMADTYRVSSGAADLTTGYKDALGTEDQTLFGLFKGCDVGGGPIAFTSEQAQNFFGGAVVFAATVSSVYSGGFDLNITVNNRILGDPDHAFVVTAFGGDDSRGFLARQLNTTSLNPTILTSFVPKGVISEINAGPGSVSSGTGGASVGRGWDTVSSGRGVLVNNNVNQGQCYRYMRNDMAWADISPTTGLITDQRTFVFFDNGLQLSGGLGSAGRGLIIGGEVEVRAGHFQLTGASGLQTVSTEIANYVVFLATDGSNFNNSVLQNLSQHVLGIMDGTRQNCFWSAEDAVGVVPIQGAHELSDTDCLLFCDNPNRGSSTITARASFFAFDDSTGTFTINVTQSDGIPRDVNWLAIGVPVTPVPPPPESCLRPGCPIVSNTLCD